MFSYKISVNNKGQEKIIELILYSLIDFYEQIETQFKGSIETEISSYIETNKDRLNEVIDGELKLMI
jgi:hypothetical protein